MAGTQVSRTLALKIQRSLAGKVFPFDRVYLFQQEDELLIPRIFPYSMVLSLTGTFRKMFDRVVKEDGSSNILVASAMSRTSTETMQKELGKSNLKTELDQALEHPDKWIVAVPMLWRMKSGKTIWPQYLAARARFGRKTKKTGMSKSPLLAQVVSSRSYLLVGGKSYRPVCLICTRALESIQGKCIPGNVECYDGLTQTGVAQFARGLRNFIRASKEAEE